MSGCKGGSRSGGARGRAVTLNRSLTLEAAQDVADGAGGCTRTWATLGTIWGQVTPRSGRMANGETGAVSVAGFIVLVRGAPEGHAARPRAGQRLIMGSRRLLIAAVTENDPQGRYLRLTCEEEVAV